MSLLGKLKTAIKGNPVLKEHDLGKHVASAGPGLLWKIYDGVKKSTQQAVSIFIFNKHTPEIDKLPKSHREELFEMLRKGPIYLAKLRHPKILTLHHTVEESSDCIAFTTEPVSSCLANVLGHYENLPSPLPLSIKEFQLHGLEAHYGLLQVTEAIEFLHSDVKMIHGNINPENIVITKNGDWKLTGFNFASYDNYQVTAARSTFHFKEYNTNRGCYGTNPHLDYLAPEYILSDSYDTRSDLYSFGMLAYALYNGGSPLYQNHNNTRTFKHNAEQISRISESGLGDTPILLRPLVRELLAIEPSVRPDGSQIKKHAFFDDVLVSTLRYLDTLYSKSDMEKSQWFKTVLGKMVIKLPKRIVHQRVFPSLVEEFRNHKMIPFVLPIVLLIADDCTMHEYSTLVLPALIPVFKIHNPVQIPLIILQKMDLILKKTTLDEMKQHILPMILATLESDNSQVQELCVSILPTFADMIDYSSMKHSIVPRLTALCVNCSTVSLAVKCLVTLGQIVDSLDKEIILEHVIPVIVKIPSCEPGVLMGILGIFHKAMTSKNVGFDKELIAKRVLPYLIPLSIQSTLNKNQFGQFMIVIKDLMKKMEADHNSYLDQVAKMEEQTKSTVEFAREVSSIKASEDALKGIESMSGLDKHDDFIQSRVGGSAPTAGYKKPSSPKNVKNGNDMFAGLNISESTNPTKTTPTISNMRRIDFSEGHKTFVTDQQPLGTWDVPLTAAATPPSSSSRLFSGSKGSTSNSSPSGMRNNITQTGTSFPQPSGLTTGPLTPDPSAGGWSNKSGTRMGLSGTGTGVLQPVNTTTDWSSFGESTEKQTLNPGMASLHSNSPAGGWSSSFNEPSKSGGGASGLLQPTSATADWSSSEPFSGMGAGLLQPNPAMGTGLPQPNYFTSGSSSGMGTGLLQPTPTAGSSSGMGTGLLQPNPTAASSVGMGTGLLQPTPTAGSSSGMGTGLMQPTPVPGSFSGIGTGPLQPAAQPTPSGSGWSTTIQQSNSGMGTGLLHPTNTSNNEVPSSGFQMETQPSSGLGMGSNPSTGWSSSMSDNSTTGMGTGIHQSNSASGWSSGIVQSSFGMEVQHGAGGMLKPQQPTSGGWSSNADANDTWGWSMSGTGRTVEQQTTKVPPQSNANVGIAPGPNPFADFNSLI